MQITDHSGYLQLNFSEILNPKAVSSHALSVGIFLFRGGGPKALSEKIDIVCQILWLSPPCDIVVHPFSVSF